MPVRFLDAARYREKEPMGEANADWRGNNAAFTCPLCFKVFIVMFLNNEGANGRPCPSCGKSVGFVSGSAREPGSQARIEWELEEND